VKQRLKKKSASSHMQSGDVASGTASASAGASSVAAAAPTAGSRPSSILVLHNVAKKKNFGELIRTAAALGATEIVVVGAQKLQSFGAHGCANHMRFCHFDKFADAVAYLHNVRGCTITGVEITPDARPVQSHPFAGSTAFLMGNEGQGLTPSQIAQCDNFVYIPQHSDATASLNVNAACAVVLHQFAMWAALPEATRDGYKYVQGAPPSSTPHSGMGLKQMRTLLADGTVAPRRRGPVEEGDECDDAEEAEAFQEQAAEFAMGEVPAGP
jgi:tRNA G18 (ribose-2'-O)-methylase SpoU